MPRLQGLQPTKINSKNYFFSVSLLGAPPAGNSFVEERKWETVETLFSWKAPDSVQMSLVSYFFKLSMVLRSVHTTVTEVYQLPYWVSYVRLAVATILMGGVLVLVLSVV